MTEASYAFYDVEEVGELQAENKRLREALTFYAERMMYPHDDDDCSMVCKDEGDVAREALGVTDG